ncbi:(acyl-carrier-protein) S-malonyltransferase [Sphaerochaeta pleomorpha str. Grapes]|uniref:Malonyl CoA-acyl carrier protein transacylase n=1 Tax=Sphaerochaeta pleomorpha (strain ATCC BAA-1885 / DSM 22778 / Grapes) TaxID=158190 RepID=G8QV64_SPHPG|nr:ACP S-malonyltransferase [Sphaerochaeta pleomorpha]AEV29300.1 (acyl-carrier-protein) S-malonyltransferase [Sphaerochaeta pleomorpha str. Grapes]
MVKLIALYPGQGSQFPKMALDLFDASKKVQDLFALASEVCSEDLYKILSEGSEQDLQDTRVTQLVVTLANRAAYTRLQEKGVDFLCHAGFSLGELSAYAAGGIFDEKTLFTIVKKRGLLMAKAAGEAEKKQGKLGMAAVIGLGFAEVETLLKTEKIEGLYCANDNGPKQVVISGRESMIAQAKDLLMGNGARKVIPLKVSGPFHTPFMDDATAEFSEFLASCTFFDPIEPVISSVNGDFVQSKKEALSHISRQLASPLRWTATMQRAVAFADKQESVLIGELGGKDVLSGLWRSSGLPYSCKCIGTEAAIETIGIQEKEVLYGK